MRLVLAAAALAALLAGPAGAQTAVEVAIDGAAHRFAPEIDRGDFRSPAGFTQRNVCGRNPALPHYEVCFRPDREGGRMEAVFEYGSLRAGKEEARDLGPHRVRIYDGAKLLAEVEVPGHWWRARWRWQSAPRPVWRTPDELREAGLVPAFDRFIAGRGKSRAARYEGPMGRAGVTKGMGNTGERCDIGIFTCHQAKFLLGDRLALASVLAQGEAAASVPWHFRDERTGAPVRFDDPEHLRITTHSNIDGPERVWRTKADGWKPDTSHQPALAFLPWVLTGDPYFLEELQFQHAFNVIWSPAGRGKRYGDVVLKDAVTPDQVRGVAWSTRTLAQLAATTPEKTPSWLLPRAYYERASRENGAALTWRAENAKGATAAFRQFLSGGGKIAPWQNDMLLAVTSYALMLGREEYRPIRDWLLQGARARLGLDGSGWPRQLPTFYYETAKGVANWAELWRNVQEKTTKKGEVKRIVLPKDPNALAKADSAYVNYLRGALALAVATGHPELEEAHDWLLGALRGSGRSVMAKWAFAAQAAPRRALAGERPGG